MAKRPQDGKGMGGKGRLPPCGPQQPHPREGGGLWERSPPISHPCDGWPLSTGKMVAIRSPKAGEEPGGGPVEGREQRGAAPFHPDEHSSESSRVSRGGQGCQGLGAARLELTGPRWTPSRCLC